MPNDHVNKAYLQIVSDRALFPLNDEDLVSECEKLHDSFYELYTETGEAGLIEVANSLSRIEPTAFSHISSRYSVSRNTGLILKFLVSTFPQGANEIEVAFPSGDLAELLADYVKNDTSHAIRGLKGINRFVYSDNKKNRLSNHQVVVVKPESLARKNSLVKVIHQVRQEEFTNLASRLFPNARIFNYLTEPEFDSLSQEFNKRKVVSLLKEIGSRGTKISRIVIECRPAHLSPMWSSERTIFHPENTLVIFWSEPIPNARCGRGFEPFHTVDSDLSLPFLEEILTLIQPSHLHLALDSQYSFLSVWALRKFSRILISAEFCDTVLENRRVDRSYAYWHPFTHQDPIRYAVNVIGELSLLSSEIPVYSKRGGRKWSSLLSRLSPRSKHFTYYPLLSAPGPVGKRQHKKESPPAVIGTVPPLHFVYASNLGTGFPNEEGILAFLRFIHEETPHKLTIFNSAHDPSEGGRKFDELARLFEGKNKSKYFSRVPPNELGKRAPSFDYHLALSCTPPISYSTWGYPQRIITMLQLGVPSIYAEELWASEFNQLIRAYDAGICINLRKLDAPLTREGMLAPDALYKHIEPLLESRLTHRDGCSLLADALRDSNQKSLAPILSGPLPYPLPLSSSS